jgi:hypothetical protein
MTTAIFDTLQYAKKLKKAGVSEGEAEAQAEALAEIFEKQVATKIDISELKFELIKWMLGIATGQLVAFISIMKYLH